MKKDKQPFLSDDVLIAIIHSIENIIRDIICKKL